VPPRTPATKPISAANQIFLTNDFVVSGGLILTFRCDDFIIIHQVFEPTVETGVFLVTRDAI
jgi:hypothetical protein